MLIGRAWLLVLPAGLAAALGLALASPTIISSGPLLVVIAGVEGHRARQRTARRAAARQLPPVIDGLIQQLRSGRSLAQACRRLDAPEVGPTVAALQPLAGSLRSGRPLAEAAACLLDDQDRSVRLLAVTLGVLAVNGGPAVPALQRLRHTLIGVVHGRQRAEAESSQARASAAMLVLAPGLFGVVVAAVDPRAASLYLFEPLGAACVLSAIAFSWLGWWWIHRVLLGVERRVL